MMVWGGITIDGHTDFDRQQVELQTIRKLSDALEERSKKPSIMSLGACPDIVTKAYRHIRA